MGGYHQLPVTPFNPEPPSEALKNSLAMRGMMQQQQLQGQQIEQGKIALQDHQAGMKAMQEWDGKDPADIPQLLHKNGASPQTVASATQAALQQKQEKLSYDQKTFEMKQQHNDFMLGALKSVTDGPDEQLGARLTQKSQELVQQGILDPQHADTVQQLASQPPAAIRQSLTTFEKGYMGEKEQFAQAQKERETAASELQAKARMIAAAKPQEGELQLGDKVPQLNQALQARFQVLNPGKPLPPMFQLPANATQKDFDRIDKVFESQEKAMGVKAQQATASAIREQTAATAAGTRTDKRSDQSYQFNSSQLEKVAQPVDQAISRLGRLQDAIAQNSPQADALIAPELLSVMAGGAGSGLRMNEAEISRLVGGRSKWESLKASINQWSLDPSKANSITPEQRQQIRSLVSEVDRKLKAKQSALDEARNSLINASSPEEHRKIVAGVRSKMSQIDQAAGADNSGMVYARDPQGKLHQAPAGTKLPDGWKEEKR